MNRTASLKWGLGKEGSWDKAKKTWESLKLNESEEKNKNGWKKQREWGTILCSRCYKRKKQGHGSMGRDARRAPTYTGEADGKHNTDETEHPGSMQNSMILPHLLCSQHWGTSPNSQQLCRKEGQKIFMWNAFGLCRIYSKYWDKILSCPWTLSIFWGLVIMFW